MITLLNKTSIDFEKTDINKLKNLCRNWLELCLSALEASESLPQALKDKQYKHALKYVNFIRKILEV